MTTVDKLNYLNGTKEAIKQAIIDKGVTVSDSDTFRSYATKIGQIQGGGEVVSSPYAGRLLIWLDAINNTSVNTHSDTATSWFNNGAHVVDTTGASITGKKIGLSVFGNDYLRLSNEGSGFYVKEVSPIFKTNRFTLEVTFTIPEPKDTTQYICGVNQNGGFSIRMNKDCDLFGYGFYTSGSTRTSQQTIVGNFADKIGKKCYMAYIWSSSGIKCVAYCDGEEYEATNSYISTLSIANQEAAFSVGYDASLEGKYDAYQFYGDINSVRLYVNNLPDEIIEQNIAYARQRFNF